MNTSFKNKWVKSHFYFFLQELNEIRWRREWAQAKLHTTISDIHMCHAMPQKFNFIIMTPYYNTGQV